MKATASNNSEAVVLLHGFGGSPRWMTLLGRRIAHTGRRVVNWGYPTWRRSIGWSASRLVERVGTLADDPTIQRIHFVTYSMGSIICRAALLDDSLRKEAGREMLGRVVMLGPPNQGSHVASFFAPWIGGFVPAVAELATAPHSFVNGLPRLHGIEVGVIAAERDRIVRHHRTHLPCQREHVTVRGGHTRLIFSRDVASKALRFIESGSFVTDSAVDAAPAIVVAPLGDAALDITAPLKRA